MRESCRYVQSPERAMPNGHHARLQHPSEFDPRLPVRRRSLTYTRRRRYLMKVAVRAASMDRQPRALRRHSRNRHCARQYDHGLVVCFEQTWMRMTVGVKARSDERLGNWPSRPSTLTSATVPASPVRLIVHVVGEIGICCFLDERFTNTRPRLQLRPRAHSSTPTCFLSLVLDTWPGISMRPLTEEESKAVFAKLANYIVSTPSLAKCHKF